MWKRARKISDEDRDVGDRDKSLKKTFDRAVNLLTYRPRSVAELRERLLEKTWTDEEIVGEVIAKLEYYGYLDDLALAKDLAGSKLRRSPVGERRLRLDLKRKRLDDDVIERAVAAAYREMPAADVIDRAIDKRLRLRGRPESRSDRKKFFDHLMRLGFDYDLICDKVRELDQHQNTGR